MKSERDEIDLRVTRRGPGDEVAIEGELSEASLPPFENAIEAIALNASGVVTLDLTGLDIEDGVALATAINSLRRLLKRSQRVVLKGAPQMLCHNLYRAGLLDGDSIELVDMRLDEPSGI